MKRALRIIVPILLILLILASSIWYLLVYDPGFTRDTILSAARAFDNSGHYKTAAWLYDLAYKQSGGGDAVAVELAAHYKSIGNYTKAEYTLSGAIADGGTAELYIALCQTYVEQDKILDAIDLLNSIQDPKIKEQIDARRPAAPVFDLDKGFYSQYVTVTVSCTDADLYINTQGEYPSTSGITGQPSHSVTLPQGETTIYAVAINQDNLVSDLSFRGYIIGGVIEEITFTDTFLEDYVRQLLNFSAGRKIYSNDLWSITELQIPEEVNNYSDLKYFTYLQKLTISACGDADLTSLGGLKELTSLSITDGDLSQESLKAIGSLTSLQQLTLSHCGLSSIAPLDGLVNLELLDLSGNTLRNISVLSGYTKLRELYMAQNVLTDLDSLAGMKDLRVLDVSHNSLLSLSPIYVLTGLQTLKAGNNAVSAIDGIGALNNLQILELQQNGLSDISPLAGCIALTELNISSNRVRNLDVLVNLVKLIRLDAAHNEISELPAFTGEHMLSSLNIAYNTVTKLDPLSVLNELYFLDLDHNEGLTSLDPLVNNRKLFQVNCFDTGITSDPFLTDRGVVVNLSFPTEE